MKNLWIVGLALFIGAATVLKIDEQKVVHANNQFAEDYWKSKKDKKNYFISPVSISAAMAMTYAGAKEGTAVSFEKVMHFDNSDGMFHQSLGSFQRKLNENMSEVEWNLANRLWGFQGPFVEDFLTLNKEVYNAPIEFGANEERINSWVEDQTKNKIKDLLPMGIITPDTRMILTNAVYFKADWKYAFKEKNTSKKPFHLSNGTQQKVEMMYQKGGFAYGQDNRFQMIKLPYKGEKQSMVVFLPIEGSEADLSSISLAEVERVKYLSPQNVKVYLPKFKLEYKELLNDFLVKQGMKDAFGAGADFSGIMTTEPIWIDAVIHKSFVEVSEKGTEAAAATAVVMTTESTIGPPRDIVFNANRPFVFYIMDDVSGAILFMGKVENPIE